MADQSATLVAYERTYGPFVHMSQPEKSIWLRWLIAGGTRHAPFTYDIRVGDGLQMPPDSDGFAIRAAYALTTKRIDVMYFDGDVAIIVEVKQRAGAAAVGQLITYRDLLLKSPNPPAKVAMLLITDQLQPDMETVLRENGIFWNEVGQ